MSARPIRVLLVEDHQMVREGLCSLLESTNDMTVLAEAHDGADAIRVAEERGPDVVVMDVSLPGLNGIDATLRLNRRRPDIPVVMLSMHDDAATVDRALRAGARGYVLKGAGVEYLCDAIRAVYQGEVYLSSGISDYILQGYLNSDDPHTDPLTEREREVLQLIAEGYTSREIAERLDLKTKTVQNHRANIMDKLDIRTTAGLVRYALSNGLIN
ncbi:MAG: DNA-binding response regulator [Myxococcales bacterium]|nr:DNA-binding response regulator [Myxococcales bacterium]